MNSSPLTRLILLASLLFASSAGARPVKKLWTVRHASSGLAFSSAVDTVGNVAVAGLGGRYTGHTYLALYTSADGALLWEVSSPDKITLDFNNLYSSVAFDHAGNVLVSYSYKVPAGYSHVVYRTEKYAASGERLWSNRKDYYSDYYYYATPLHLVVDKDDNVIVSGRFDLGAEHFVLDKYAGKDGDVLWENHNSQDPAFCQIGLDHSGNILASGSSSDSGYGFHENPFASKCAGADGRLLWKDLPFDGDGAAVPTALAADRFGNILITGNTTEEGCVSDDEGYGYCYAFPVAFYTFKLAPNGHILWKHHYFPDFPRSGDYNEATSTAVASDGKGNVIVAGRIVKDCYLAKYDANDGKTQWEKRILSLDRQSPAVAADDDDSVILACTHRRTRDYGNLLTAKYAADGSTLWKQLYAGLRDVSDVFNSLEAGPGFVVVHGVSESKDYRYADVSIKYVDGATPRTLSADGISATGATLHGAVNPNGFAATAFFEYGTDPDLAGAVVSTPVTVGNQVADILVDLPLTSLSPTFTYYFRTASTANGCTTHGEIRQFTTLPRWDFTAPSPRKTR